ncbi:PilN domain-containing protein [Bacillus sp. CGMCC 1.16607]|uniref:PilN domain-containing protein n=1 Tax=Bacillus sp. CGMCC 1.16607 TaxID=3351842 RepID=UPI00363EE035
MLIDINLLPKKEKKNFSLSIMLALLIFIFLIGAIASFYYGSVLKNESLELEKKINQLDENLKVEQAQVEKVQATNSVVELKNAVDWAQNYPIKSVPVLQHLTSLLPERGFIQNYSYSEEGTILLTVQFDTSREAAYFLNWLTESDWIVEANILKLGLGDQTKSENEDPSPEAEFVPRYIGDYEITLEREKVKELNSEVSHIEQGGNGS